MAGTFGGAREVRRVNSWLGTSEFSAAQIVLCVADVCHNVGEELMLTKVWTKNLNPNSCFIQWLFEDALKTVARHSNF